MSASFDWSKYKKVPSPEIPKESTSSEFDWSKYRKVEPISKSRSVAGAYPKGLLRGLADAIASADPTQIALKAIGKDPNEALKRISNQVLPTRDETAENILQRAGELTPLAAIGPESLPMKGAQLAGGTLLGQLAKEEGAGELEQGIAEAVGFGIPGLAKGAYEGALNLVKGQSEKLPSGLSKLEAISAKFPEKAIISPERQAAVIKSLDQEAAKLTEGVLSKRLPILKEIEKGIDFEKKFEDGFAQLKKAAQKYNPSIDISPVQKLFQEESNKFRGIPTLHSDAKKIVEEIKRFRRRPVDSLEDLLKIFRSNNQKRKHIFETSMVSGKQKEYSDFLGEMNRSISESFEKTFPKDSVWMKQFRDLNKNYSEYKNALSISNDLKKILQKEATPATLTKFEDPKFQKKLETKIGKEGAHELSQIAKDLKLAKEAVNKIPVREFKFWEKYLPLSLFVPGVGKAVSFAKVPDYVRRSYGFFLSTSEKRKLYDEALQAIIRTDKEGYLKATKALSDSIQEHQSTNAKE